MLQKLLTSALSAGCAAWLLAAVLHFAFVQEYILLGESYESGAAVHFTGVAATDHASEHTHADGADAAHDHGTEPSGEQSTLVRNLWTVVFHGLVYVAYALVMVAGFGLAKVYGREVTAREGLLWGIAGFAVFQLAPAMGLAPELPGTPAADLGDRQLWWWGTALATAAGLGLLAYGKGAMAVALAVVLLAAPHVIGAPGPDGFGGVAPPEVAASFAARVLGVGFAVWALMGWVAGLVWAKGEGAFPPRP